MPAIPTLSTILSTIGVAAVLITVLISVLSVVTGRIERRQAASAAPAHRPVAHRPNEEDRGDLTVEELAGLPVTAETVPATPATVAPVLPAPRVDVTAAEREHAHSN